MIYRTALALITSLGFIAFSQAQFIESDIELIEQSNAELGLLSTERPELINETLHLQGQISVYDFVQPETRIWLEANGQSWELIAPSAVELRRLGWSSNSLFVGESVEVEVTRLLGTENIVRLNRLTRANGALLLTALGEGGNQITSFTDIPGGMYALDTKQSHLQFAFSHMGFSQTSVKIERVIGNVLWNAESPESSIIQLDFDASSLHSGVTELDEALRGSEFFDFLNHPKIRFKSTQLQLSKWGVLKVGGQLEILGINQPVQLEARLNKVGENPLTLDTTVGISITGKLNRSGWGLVNDLPTISDTIEINFQGEFILTAPESLSGFLAPMNNIEQNQNSVSPINQQSSFYKASGTSTQSSAQ